MVFSQLEKLEGDLTKEKLENWLQGHIEQIEDMDESRKENIDAEQRLNQLRKMKREVEKL